MLLSDVSVLIVAQSISEIHEGLMNNPVHRGSQADLPINFVCYDPVFGALSLEHAANQLSASLIFEVAPTFLENIWIPAVRMCLQSLLQDVSITTHFQSVIVPYDARHRSKHK